MRLSEPRSFCMAATPFTASGDLDEAEFRAHLRRIAGTGTGLYLASPGSGEGHALSLRELRRVYEIGAEECKGRVPVYANPPETRTAREMLERCREAAASGVDVVQIYQVDGGHGMRPTAVEQERYYKTILDGLDHPVALSAHGAAGFLPSPALFSQLCKAYPQIAVCNIFGASTGLNYFVAMKDALGPRIDIFTGWDHPIEALSLDAKGFLAGEANLAPYLCRSVIEHFLRGEIRECGAALANLARLANILNRWAPSSARWVKMGMRVLGLPGGAGILREPYLMPSASELDEMAKAFRDLGLERIDELSRQACLRTRAP
jgi:4-hydroxy-tetrahydrodipicolinate synthase